MATASVAVRLNAITGEFETAFKNATRTVAGFEKTFGSSASSMVGHQQRMNAAFKEFSGDKIIAEANQLAGAINKVGGASNLTASEQKKANAVFTEALAKLNALGEGSSAAAQKMAQLANATRQVEQPMSFAGKAMGVLGSTFAQFTAANLAATALTKLASGIGDFAAQGAKLPGLQASFESLTRGVGSSSADMLASLQGATRGLVTNIDLMQSANKAILLGLPVTTKEMGDLAKTATVLGKAMGQDATKSLDDLITALGRSSPLILDNLGLSVKVGEANEKYAAALGKTVEQLTDAEKKTAFYNAAMEAARAKVLELGEQTRTFGEIVDSVWVRVGNNVTETISDLNVGIGANIEALLRLIPKTKEAGDAALEASTKEKSWGDELKLSVFASAAAALGLGPYVQNLELHAQAAKESADVQRILNKLMADAPKPQDVFKLGGPGSRPNQFGTGLLDPDEVIKGWIQDQKDAEAAAKRHAEALAALDKKIADLKRGTSGLTEENKKAIKAFTDLGLSASEVALKLRLSEIAVSKYTEAEKNRTEATKLLAKESIAAVTEMYNEMAKQGRLGVAALAKELIEYQKALEIMRDVRDVIGTDRLPGVTLPTPRITREQEDILDAELDRLKRKFEETWGVINDGARQFGHDLASVLAEGIITGDWSHVKDAVQDAAARFISAGIEAGVNFLVPGLGTLMKPLIDAVSQKIIGLFRDAEHENVNDLRDDYLSQFGTGAFVGFNELARQLHELGPAGDALFQRVINATRVEEFNRAMADANAALDRAFAARPENQAAAAGFLTAAELQSRAQEAVRLFEYIRDSGLYTAETVEQAWQRAQDALERAGDTSIKNIKTLKNEIEGLQAELSSFSGALEAEQNSPEYDALGNRIFGVIEQEMLARREAIEAEIKAKEEAIRAETEARSAANTTVTEEIKTQAEEINTRIRELFARPIDAHIRFSYDNPPSGISLPTSSVNYTGGGSSPSIAPASVTVGPEVGTTTAVIQMDGQTITEVVVPHIPGVVRRYGLA